MLKNFIPLLFLSIIWISCNDDDMLFEIGNDDVNVRTKMAMIDTFIIKSYTVMLDSIPTSGVERPSIIVGNIHDEQIGTFNVGSFFRFDLPSKIKPNSYSIDENALFDSLRFFMVYNGYFEGDTTAPLTIDIHRLKDRLKPNTDGFYYNNDSIPAFSETIGSSTFSPAPRSRDTVWITLDADLGREFFAKLKNNELQFLENDRFDDFFKGIMLRGNINNRAVLGFSFPSSDTNNVGMRLYYHYYDFTTITKKLDFLAQPSATTGEGRIRMQFNRFTLTDALIDFPVSQRQKLPVGLTNEQSYVMSGVGLLTRLEIPYLRNLNLLGDNIRILSAELLVEPVAGTYDNKTLPSRLTLHETTNSNHWGLPMYDRSGNQLIAYLNLDMLYQENTYYSFDITRFIVSSMQKQTEEIPAMLLHVAGDDFYRSAKRLILGSQSHEESDIKLKVYYINVN